LTQIKKIPIEERPRERCLLYGPQTLSLRECLAILIGSGPQKIGCLGVAKNILNKSQKHLHAEEAEHAFFANFHSFSEVLANTKGLGNASLARILVALDLGRRYHEHLVANTPDERGITKDNLEKNILKRIPTTFRSMSKEWIGFVPVYSERKIGKLSVIEKGARHHVNFEPARLFSRILILQPVAFALFHNHPSGRISPSNHDRKITNIVAEIAQHLGIIFLGHWVVAQNKSCKIEQA